MKKILGLAISVMLVTITALSFTGCAGLAEDQVKKALDEVNKSYPQELAGGITINKAEIVGNDVIFDCTTDPEVFIMEEAKANQQAIKENMTKMLKDQYSSDENVKTFISLVALAKKNVKYKYTDAESGETMEIVIDNDTLMAF